LENICQIKQNATMLILPKILKLNKTLLNLERDFFLKKKLKALSATRGI